MFRGGSYQMEPGGTGRPARTPHRPLPAPAAVRDSAAAPSQLKPRSSCFSAVSTVSAEATHQAGQRFGQPLVHLDDVVVRGGEHRPGQALPLLGDPGDLGPGGVD